ncbi:cellulose biosynthesis protein BcsE [Dyella sp. C9]|uniref:cellulose biosynthesis protein BcsE n=1 Tax=Dyella sp. C9 TaxID=2202154 RepID=UPI000DEFD964|nr:cellulose biosynthesis protein BcsE [Dyella sp. C9]
MKNYPAQASTNPSSLVSPALLRMSQTLAIEGLPLRLSTLAAGQAYVVYANRSPARDAMFWGTAANAVHSPVTVLSGREPENLIASLREHGVDIDVPRSVHPKANVCTLSTLPGRDSGEVLMEALQALSDQCALAGSQFLIEGAAAFFNWQDGPVLVRQGERLARWCAEHRHSVLLVMSPPLVEEDKPAPALAEFQMRFAGVAQLAQVEGEYRWEVSFWRSNRQTLAASESIPLRFSPDDHRLVAVAETQGEEGDGHGPGLLAPDEAVVMLARDEVMNERTVPRDWQVFDNNDALAAAAAGSVAATVLLHHHHRENMADLAKQVNQLRRQCGKALKIIVREENITVRYELLMLNLGANMVIPSRLPVAQVEVLVDGVQGQLFSRPVPADYRSVLSATVRDPVSGYVPTPRFVELVRAAVDRSRVIRLPNVVTRLLLQTDVAAIDALRACTMRRSGDLCTASGDSVYVFFFACHVEDAGKACQRAFKLPLGELFQGELRCGDRTSIMDLLASIEQEISQLPAPDYSGYVDATATDDHFDTMASDAAGNALPVAAPGAAVSPATAADKLPGIGAADEAVRSQVARRVPQAVSLPLKAQG